VSVQFQKTKHLLDATIDHVWSRREFLIAGAAGATCLGADYGKGRTFASKISGYPDPSTEFPVMRLTDPAFTSVLPTHLGRPISRRGNFLLFSADASGKMNVFRLDYRSGEARQLTEAEQLKPRSVNMLADERSVLYVDGDRLVLANFSTLRTRDVYRAAEGFELTDSAAVTEDGLFAMVAEKKEARHRLRLLRMADGNATTLIDAEEELFDPMPRPRRASVLFRRGKDAWLANFDAQQKYRLKTAEGETAEAMWSPDGRGVLYLNLPADKKQLNAIREFTPDTNEDKAVANTTQFVTFQRNGDASVFVGASGSKASPHVLLLVRSVRRELILCEHKASDPRMVAPVFSPNSQRVFFTSDQHGKSAIYSMQIEKLVSETGDDAK
jgi:oligogalacturonide lyase